MNESTREWLEKARGDLRSAEVLAATDTSAHADVICFLCQQAAEKTMKAVLISRNLVPPRTHNLPLLHQLLCAAVPTWTWNIDELNELGQGAVDYRYPGESAEARDALRALEIARRLAPALEALLEPID